ncbi:MAG: YqaJ viral recombinase family protein, partial [Pseudomonadales bacterium]|nr:YqaJ viral recombinase family protein [Pseudomonadales bacterium]
MNLPNVVPANPPALRLVSTKAMSREDWLDVRRRGIGASEAAAACGISPYQSPLELWLIKTGRDK